MCRSKWTLLVDTREQTMLDVAVDGAKVERDTLPVGDYGLRDPLGRLFPLVVERKTVADLFGTFGRGYRRFRREIARAKEAKVQMVMVVEGARDHVALGLARSSRSGASVIRQLNTIFLRHELPYIYATGHGEAGRVVSDLLGACVRNYGKGKRK